MIIQNEKNYGFCIRVLGKNNVWYTVYKSEYFRNIHNKIQYFRMLNPSKVYKVRPCLI